MTQESEASKRQWPPVGKSSDTPKEVKNARREGLPPVIREARGYGAGCVYTHYSYPNNMKCVICTELVNIQNEEICEECYLDL